MGSPIRKPASPETAFHLRHTTNDVLYKVDISTLKKHDDVKEFQLNDISCISLRTSSPIFLDIYSKNRTPAASCSWTNKPTTPSPPA